MIFIEFSPNQGEAVEMELLNVEVDEWEIEGNRVLLQEGIWSSVESSPYSSKWETWKSHSCH